VSDDDSNQANRNYNRRIAAELAEANEPRNRAQAQLDRWFQERRDFEIEFDDYYEVGGFQERWSQTPGFHKTRRDRDWRVK
jgi:hypothetical protein